MLGGKQESGFCVKSAFMLWGRCSESLGYALICLRSEVLFQSD